MSMALVITSSRCKSCGYCVNTCPKKALSISEIINDKGYETVKVDPLKCIACGICYTVCPDYVFSIKEEAQPCQNN